MQFDWRSFLDWVSIISAIGTVVAAGFAAWAIQQSSKQAKANTELVVNERRRDVQLDALQRLGEIVAETRNNDQMHSEARRRATVQLAVLDAALPTCRTRWSSANPSVVAAAFGLDRVIGWMELDGTSDVSGRLIVDVMIDEITAAVRAIAGTST